MQIKVYYNDFCIQKKKKKKKQWFELHICINTLHWILNERLTGRLTTFFFFGEKDY